MVDALSLARIDAPSGPSTSVAARLSVSTVDSCGSCAWRWEAALMIWEPPAPDRAMEGVALELMPPPPPQPDSDKERAIAATAATPVEVPLRNMPTSGSRTTDMSYYARGKT